MKLRVISISLLTTTIIVTVLLFASIRSLAAEPLGTTLFKDELWVGFADTDITPVIGVPLGGFGGGKRRLLPWDVFDRFKYATYLKPSEGKLDPIRAKVMSLRKGDERLLFIGLDLVGFGAINQKDVYERVKFFGYKEHEIIISSTHTHSGPGTLFKNFIFELIAVDKFQKRIYERFLEGIFDTVSRAHFSSQPAKIFANTFEATGLTRNRRIDDGPVDREAHLLTARSKASGRYLGALAGLAIHGTSLGTSNFKFSADNAGAIERSMEQTLFEENARSGRKPTVVFINGAEGDVTPVQRGFEHMDKIGEQFSEMALPALRSARELPPQFEIQTKRVKFITPGLNLKGCVEPGWLRAIFWSKIRLFLPWWMPKRTTLAQVQIGDLLMMSWPGEPTTALGLALKKAAKDAGINQAWVMGLTNDYLAYFTTPKEYHRAAYEACNTLYGDSGGERIIRAHQSLLTKLQN